MSNKLRKIISSFLVLIILFGIIPVKAESKGDLVDPVNFVGNDKDNGAVKLTKTVSEVNKEKGIYKVNFDITSKNAVTTIDKTNPLYVVVVFDTSGSMCDESSDNCGDKWNNAITGAINFSEELLKNIKDANIALVNFSSTASTTREFSSEKLTSSDFKSPNGGTNIALGLSTAKYLLDDITKENAKKFIVLMTDGEPQVYTNIVTDYLARLETKKIATKITDASIEFFAVGYDTTTSNSDFLKTLVTTPSSKYYTDLKIDDIKTKFNNLVPEILKFPAGEDVIITDTIGKSFSYVLETASNGVIVDEDKVTYKIDKLTEDKISFSFNIQIDEKSNTGWHKTNSSASITYIDSLGKEITKNIEKSSKVYWEAPKYDYVINYYKDEINKDNLIDSIKENDDYNKEITVDTKYKLPEGYSYIGEELKFNIKEDNNEINVIYSKKDSLTYCVNYFYGGIIDINNTECYYNQSYGKEITSFIDKSKEGYVFENFEPITVLDKEENIMNVYYKKLDSGEIVPPKTNINKGNLIIFTSISSILIIGIYTLRKYINV